MIVEGLSPVVRDLLSVAELGDEIKRIRQELMAALVKDLVACWMAPVLDYDRMALISAELMSLLGETSRRRRKRSESHKEKGRHCLVRARAARMARAKARRELNNEDGGHHGP